MHYCAREIARCFSQRRVAKQKNTGRLRRSAKKVAKKRRKKERVVFFLDSKNEAIVACNSVNRRRSSISSAWKIISALPAPSLFPRSFFPFFFYMQSSFFHDFFVTLVVLPFSYRLHVANEHVDFLFLPKRRQSPLGPRATLEILIHANSPSNGVEMFPLYFNENLPPPFPLFLLQSREPWLLTLFNEYETTPCASTWINFPVYTRGKVRNGPPTIRRIFCFYKSVVVNIRYKISLDPRVPVVEFFTNICGTFKHLDRLKFFRYPDVNNFSFTPAKLRNGKSRVNCFLAYDRWNFMFPCDPGVTFSF